MTTEQRLERLERQNQRLRRAVIGVVAVGLSLLVMGQTLPDKVHDVVKAREFQVIDSEGRIYAKLYRSGPSGARLTFYNPHKKHPESIVADISGTISPTAGGAIFLYHHETGMRTAIWAEYKTAGFEVTNGRQRLIEIKADATKGKLWVKK